MFLGADAGTEKQSRDLGGLVTGGQADKSFQALRPFQALSRTGPTSGPPPGGKLLVLSQGEVRYAGRAGSLGRQTPL